VARTRAPKVYICNLMTKPGETSGFDAAEHVREVVRYLGRDVLDYVILSNTRLSKRAIRGYARKNQAPVEPRGLDRLGRITKARIILADVVNETELVRHDSRKLAAEIEKIIR
jgi:uncharacterized cofD-like protein